MAHHRDSPLPPTIFVGRDTRESGTFLENALCHGLQNEGIIPHFLGVISTPGISFLLKNSTPCFGIMISASHNPYPYNGLKIMDTEGKKLSPAEEYKIFSLFHELMTTEALDAPFFMTPSSQPEPSQASSDIASQYENFLVSMGGDLEEMPVVLDGANGACCHFLERVWKQAGARVVGTIGLDPTGKNINESVGSVYPRQLQEKVLESQAELGIAVDGDGDRIIMVDAHGNIVDGDQILACLVLARRHAQQLSEKEGVVGTILSNPGLDHFLQSLRVPFVRVGVGDRCIVEELEKRGWSLGGEPCGHIIQKNFLFSGDGCAVGLAVARYWLTHKKIHPGNSSLFPLFPQWPTQSHNIAVQDMDHLLLWLQQDSITCFVAHAEKKLKRRGGGRVILRPSGTEPFLRLVIDGLCSKTVEEVSKELFCFISENLPHQEPSVVRIQ